MEQQQQQQQHDAYGTTDFSASQDAAQDAKFGSDLPEFLMDDLPMMVLDELMVMSSEKQQEFSKEYFRKKKSTGLAYVCWLILGVHYGYTRKWGLQIVFWLTAGGLGFWALIDLFRIPKLVRNCNRDMAKEVLAKVKSVSL